MTDDLRAAADAALISCLRPGVRDAIDGLLRDGVSRAEIVTRVRAQADRVGRTPDRSIVVAAVEAYLDRLEKTE